MKLLKLVLIFLVLNSCVNQSKIEIKSERFDLNLFLLDSTNYDKKLLEWEEENEGFLNY